MSATGRNVAGNERRAEDFYVTPEWCTRALLPHLTPGAVLDPCCGDGAILNVVVKEWSHITYGLEVDRDRASKAKERHGEGITWRNALVAEPWPYASQIITNPPYSLAQEFIDRAIKTERDAAFLLRINFLGSQKRAAFHREHPCDLFVLPKRPSFTNGGTDATEYAWYVWGPGRGNRWTMLDVEEPARAKRLTSAASRNVGLPGVE